MFIAELVRTAREKKGWTQKEASIKCGMSLPAYNAVECDRHVPSLYNAIVMSQTLGFDLDKIELPKDFKKGTKRAAAKTAKVKKAKPASKPKVKKHPEIKKAEKKVAEKKAAKVEKKAAKAKKPDADAHVVPDDDFNQDLPQQQGNSTFKTLFKDKK